MLWLLQKTASCARYRRLCKLAGKGLADLQQDDGSRWNVLLAEIRIRMHAQLTCENIMYLHLQACSQAVWLFCRALHIIDDDSVTSRPRTLSSVPHGNAWSATEVT